MLETEKLTLNEAITQYCKKNERIHGALGQAIIRFYGYASDEAGIRHDTNNKNHEEGYDEAKLILVGTSAFINYILSTSEGLTNQ